MITGPAEGLLLGEIPSSQLGFVFAITGPRDGNCKARAVSRVGGPCELMMVSGLHLAIRVGLEGFTGADLAFPSSLI